MGEGRKGGPFPKKTPDSKILFSGLSSNFISGFMQINTYIHVATSENRAKMPKVVSPHKEERTPETLAAPTTHVTFIS